MTREEFYKLTDILNTEVLGNFMHGGESDELIAMFEEAVDYSNILEQEEPVSDDLEDAADKYSKSIHSDYFNDMFDSHNIYDAVIYGAKWQKQQMKEALRTEYEKGRHDALEEMPKWKPAARAYLGDRLPRIDRSLDRLVARIGESEIAYYLKIEDLYKLPKEE